MAILLVEVAEFSLGICVPLLRLVRARGGHHGPGPADEKYPPVGPSAGSNARRTASAAPCSTVCVPPWSFRSVAVYPGSAEFTLIGVSLSSKASCTVSMLRAALDALYPRNFTGAYAHPASAFWASDPSPLDTFTIRPAGDRRRSGNNAWATDAGTTKTVQPAR